MTAPLEFAPNTPALAPMGATATPLGRCVEDHVLLTVVGVEKDPNPKQTKTNQKTKLGGRYAVSEVSILCACLLHTGRDVTTFAGGCIRFGSVVLETDTQRNGS